MDKVDDIKFLVYSKIRKLQGFFSPLRMHFILHHLEAASTEIFSYPLKVGVQLPS